MKNYSEITDYVREFAGLSNQNNGITTEMYDEHRVFRGLRDRHGKGVVTGLTEISKVNSRKIVDGVEVPCEGELCYRGYNVYDLVNDFTKHDRFGFEETIYLLLTSKLPNKTELNEFKAQLASMRTLPPSFVRDMILKAPGPDMMNMLSRSVLALYAYDDNPDDISVENVMRQCLFLTAVLPILSVYSYRSYVHYNNNKSLIIHYPREDYSTAENILRLLRVDKKYSDLEAKILDLSLVLHAEHGGGNNSSFTTHVVSSSGTDTYSAISAALGSLKGPRHGGANIKVVRMFEDMKKNINTHSDREIVGYIEDLLDKKAFDGSGLIYGMGHAVYTLSDPRAVILKDCARELAAEKGYQEDFELYEKVARYAPDIIGQRRKVYKGVCLNVDYYSGLIYQMLELPGELYTPMFAASRIAGWSAHRIEEIQNNGKIIRPAYVNVKEDKDYVPLSKR